MTGITRNEPTFSVGYGGSYYANMTRSDLRENGVPASVVLEVVKGDLKAAVDAKAEALRSLMATPGTGQAMEYLEAQQQAFAALANPAAATAEQYPMLKASIGIDIDPQTGQPATDVLGVARSVHAAYGQWNTLGAAIRAIRLAGKKAIEDAATDEAAAAAYTAIVWPSLG